MPRIIKEFRFERGGLDSPEVREWLARAVERALALVIHPDPRSVAVVAALRAGPVPYEVAVAAYDAAHALGPYLRNTAYHAAHAAYRAAYAPGTAPDAVADAEKAADHACMAHAMVQYTKERATQIADAVALTATVSRNIGPGE
jgi:hypothetical protein